MSNDTAGSVDGMTWEQLLNRSRELDLHAEQLFLIQSKPVDGFGPVEAALDEHLPYQKQLEDSGVMFAAGPVASADGAEWNGEGVFVYRAASLDEAVRLAEADPMHSRGARRFEVRAWCLNEGTTTRSATT
ncbi:YciI family protein [Pseudonocardia sp. MH-G8]|uniref:YciI family protein n=1 Tax=Pseudonocardia sp. MH-G8 TaxID=1854588 RepID=UPI0018E972D1|nr:YciI family protein [Pseudonocardia sp. MH-G8]